MGVFVAGSVIGGTAQEYEMIILGRAVQGFSAGVNLPLTQLAMYAVFGPDRRSTANGLFGLSFVLGPGLGPWIGGMAIDAFDWRFTFYIVLPIAASVALLASYVLPTRQETGPRPTFDWFGFALLSIALIASLTGLSNGQRLGWASDTVVLLLTLGIFSTASSARANSLPPTLSRSCLASACSVRSIWRRFMSNWCRATRRPGPVWY
jgi:MFS family permease